ncbi:MAG TPA: 4-hydroxythreonine-4-phosphate dehydrogenase PdxA [Methylomirabilota bacterium]|nr:4-hydroxythreonine-4-phosphate dehydrogenase PdxA [Methylomirabilota bacterium]
MSDTWLGITIGDVTGVGPEVTMKALAELAKSGSSTRFVLIGDEGHIRKASARFAPHLQFTKWEGAGTRGQYAIHQPSSRALTLGASQGGSEAALAAVDSLKAAASLATSKAIAGVITAPVNKEAIIRAGVKFVGQTELLSDLAGTERTAMMLLGEDDRGRWLRVALVTTHLPLRDVADAITGPKVELAIELAADSCAKLKLPRARIGLCGLNPHAGEGGKVGREEIEVIAPAVERCRQRGINVEGPTSADTLFYYAYKGDFDAVVAMYHDQGLAPLKMIGFEKGINWTLGLPFVRTSPDHGTAYDIAGKGLANPSSMLSAIALARQLSIRETGKT